MTTITTFIRDAYGNHPTTHVTSATAESQDEAVEKCIEECCDDWCCGTDEVVLIGVAEGTVHILEWNDELLST